ncbi:MAG: hypothetical protein H6Q14_1163 [Bacteroidetes bacterium]|nr:hypothetical protein [Bacteroidota bacterium]MBP1617336.1 hypothetical protein [Bacteroidota bacterium]
MIKVYAQTKIYIYAPENVVTGGAELLHQLADVLNNNRLDAYIVYINLERNVISENQIIPYEYKKYSVKTSIDIEDSPLNIVVFYEGIFHKIGDVKNAQHILWWLSVDNFFFCASDYLSIRDCISWNFLFGVTQLFRRLVRPIRFRRIFHGTVSLKKLRELEALHCYQSEYAQHFLLNNKFDALLPLSDFINTDFYESDFCINRSDKILYNPKKGMNYTKKIMSKLPEYEWTPLINMTRSQLLNEFRTGKLYIDFGYHPGKDRIPREAAIAGCCVVTNKKGSAQFFEDVPIGNIFKCDTHKKSVDNVITLIQYVIQNYESLNPDFDFYRSQILNEQQKFKDQVLNIFSNTH